MASLSRALRWDKLLRMSEVTIEELKRLNRFDFEELSRKVAEVLSVNDRSGFKAAERLIDEYLDDKRRETVPKKLCDE